MKFYDYFYYYWTKVIGGIGSRKGIEGAIEGYLLLENYDF